MSGNKFLLGLGAVLGLCLPASADLYTFTDASGLSGTADFSFSGSSLDIVLTNTSTGTPGGFSNSDQLLTSLSFTLPGGITITGGSVTISAGSASQNFSLGDLGAGTDVSGEYGFGNGGTTGLFDNFVSTNIAGATPFGGLNRDGPAVLNGPQGGLTNGLIALGGLGAIDNSITYDLTLSGALVDLSFLTTGVSIEFGSDAAFVPGQLDNGGPGGGPGQGPGGLGPGGITPGGIGPGPGPGNGGNGGNGAGGNGAIPEPASLMLALGGLLAFAAGRRRATRV